MIRRVQKDFLKSMLPPREEVLLFCRPTAEQCTVYQEMTSAQRGQPLRMEATADALTTLTNLRKLCAHPRWNSAPNASKSEGTMDENYVARSGKLMILNLLLQSIRAHAPDDKIVIVSNFTSALSLIQDSILRPQGLSYQRLDGSTELSQRHGIVDTFNKTSACRNFAFLLSSKAGGCGLNLIGGQSAYSPCRNSNRISSASVKAHVHVLFFFLPLPWNAIANRLVMFDPDWYVRKTLGSFLVSH
jgi:DNA repair and recombination protein RAD54 and RAD54-like protein